MRTENAARKGHVITGMMRVRCAIASLGTRQLIEFGYAEPCRLRQRASCRRSVSPDLLSLQERTRIGLQVRECASLLVTFTSRTDGGLSGLVAMLTISSGASTSLEISRFVVCSTPKVGCVQAPRSPRRVRSGLLFSRVRRLISPHRVRPSSPWGCG